MLFYQKLFTIMLTHYFFLISMLITEFITKEFTASFYFLY